MKLNCQKIFSLLLSLMMLITALPMASAPAYAKSDDAIPISTPEELDTLVRANLAGNFILTQDIDLTDYLSAGGPGYNGGAGWQPINDFRGIFDGNGYTISGLYSNRPNQNFVGLFAILREAKIRNLGMVGVDVRGKDFVGGLAGVAPNPSDTIFNCYVKGQVAGNTTVGGMVGQSTGLIRQSYSSCNVSAIRFDVGGLVGSHYGQIWESYTTGNVTTPTNICAGGLVGRNYRDSSILDSYATGHVSGNSMIGGLVGSNNQGSIVSSYAKGRVQKTNPLGIIGGLVGVVSDGTTERSYWDVETSEQDVSPGGAGKSTTEMKTQNTFEGWDFTDVWAMDESHDGYPYLSWLITPTIYSQPEGQTVNAGEPTSFSARASTAAGDPVNYQWKKDDVDIPGATSATLTIEAAAASDAATYTVEVSNGTRTVTSQPATLTVNPGSGGPGDDPIEIRTADDLNDVRNDLDGSYLLMNDIDLGETYGADYAGGRGWQPIYEGLEAFNGIFNGNGHTISGLYINRPDENYVGLFGLVSTDAEVFNVRLEDVDVTGNAYVGGLVGITEGSISKTGVAGTVSGTNYIGGLAGMTTADISSSYAVANVTSPGGIGGGLVGTSQGTATIENTYSLGTVTATLTGGLVGSNGGVLQRSYAAGRVISTGPCGGLLGITSSDTISNCYWDIEATDQPAAGLAVSSESAIGYSTEKMMQQETFAGWDFDTIWTIDTEPSSYPYFLWQLVSDPGTDPVAPSISDQPQNQTVTIGQTATFTVTAAGSEPLNYQWKKDGIDITGATSATLDIVNAQTSDAGIYTVEVSNDTGTILSDSATLTINPGTTDPVAPSITDQPQNQTVTIGQTATFTVTAAGSEPLNYQWKKDGIDIAGATSATLDIVNAQTSDAGIYTVEVSNDTGNIISNPATLTVNEPGDLNLLLTPGDRLVRLDWSEVPESVSYYVYQDTSYVQTVAGVYSHEVTGLTNGQTYTFEVRAIDDHDDVIATSGNHSATPRTVPGTPTNVTATAGNGQATVSFSAPASNGGSPITGYTVTASPGNSTATGTSSPITVTGLSNGTSYTFTIKATNAAGNSAQSAPSNSVTPYGSSTGGSRGSSTPSTPPTSGVNVTVNGKEGTIATADTTKVGGKTIITVAINDQQLAERLKQEGRKAVVTIPVTTQADVVIGRLNGQIVKNMEGQEAILEITTNHVSYVLPAAQINIDSISSQFGRQVELKDILIDVKIAASTLEARNNAQMVVDPVEFVITATNAGKTVEIAKFNAYVERIIALPEGVDASKITTGVVFNRDGSFSHVPTEVFEKDGKWYAKLNSLTNSTYSVIWNPVTVSSVENHWSKAYVNDMASRLVIKNPESFTPDGQITRGDFAEYIAKALGIYRAGVAKAGEFPDVASGNELADAVTVTSEYGIIAGYPDGTFKPEAKITREEAMIMYARAMDIVGLKEKNNNRIENYLDKQEISGWAYEGVKKTVSAGVFNGKTKATIDPKGMLTYAEAATAIRNLLTETKMINK